MPTSPTAPVDDAPAALCARYGEARQLTELLADPLSPEDQGVQSMPDASPTKWHRAHTTWFFETFLLGPHAPGYEVFDPAYGYLFNSYYDTVGDRHPRPERGVLSRPSAADVAYYRQHVDDAMARLLRGGLDAVPGLRDLMELGLHHEQQHQELLLMDIKHAFSRNVLEPAYRPSRLAMPMADSPPTGWVDVQGGVVEIGHDGDGFAFDNEAPRHEVMLAPFRLADRLVTAGEWLEFMAEGGYQRPELWLSDGWHTAQSQGWEAPLYWGRDDDGWSIHTLHGTRPLTAGEPVVHVSHYEADAYATWAGARLPSELEWEHAARDVELAPRDPLPRGELHPVPATPSTGLRQMFGEVWQWTSSPYIGYPGFSAAPGAVGEYNGKFMSGQIVLRGGCCASPPGHLRATYRNFFPPRSRWMFGGLRLASDQ